VDSSDDSTAQYGTAVNEYLHRAYGDERRRKLLAAGGWDPEFAAELAQLGWFALAVPEEQGGLGAPLSLLGQVFMQIGRRLVIGPIVENALLPALLQRAGGWSSVPAVSAAVETGVPLALVDPGITTDWADDVGSVVLTDGSLHGHVNAVRFAGQANALVVIADTGTGSAVHLVDPSAAGVVVEELQSADPTATFARVVLDGAVPLERHPSVPVDDDALVLRIRAWTRLLIACELSGIADRTVDRTVEYLKEREQFGRAIGSFQAVKHIAASMHASSTGLRNLCAAALADAATADDRHLDRLAATAKAHAAKTAVRVCEDAIQLHGGMGFTTENELSWYYKRTLALRGWYGDETELELRVGAELLGQGPS